MRPTLNSSEQKRCRQVVKPAANFLNNDDGVNLMCFASNRKSHAVAICNLRRFRDGRHTNPVRFDNVAHVTAPILAHPVVIMLPAAAVERIERIAERGSAQMCPGEVRLLHQVAQILRAIEIAHGDEGAASPSRRMR